MLSVWFYSTIVMMMVVFHAFELYEPSEKFFQVFDVWIIPTVIGGFNKLFEWGSFCFGVGVSIGYLLFKHYITKKFLE